MPSMPHALEGARDGVYAPPPVAVVVFLLSFEMVQRMKKKMCMTKPPKAFPKRSSRRSYRRFRSKGKKYGAQSKRRKMRTRSMNKRLKFRGWRRRECWGDQRQWKETWMCPSCNLTWCYKRDVCPRCGNTEGFIKIERDEESEN